MKDAISAQDVVDDVRIDQLLELKIDFLSKDLDIDEAILSYLKKCSRDIHIGVLRCYFTHIIGTVSERRLYKRLNHLIDRGEIERLIKDKDIFYKYKKGAKQ